MNRLRILIWGVGKLYSFVKQQIDDGKAEIIGVVDSDIYKKMPDMERLYKPVEIKDLEFDAIIISTKKYSAINQVAESLGIPKNKLYSYWNLSEDIPFVYDREKAFIDSTLNNIKLQNRLECLPYELEVKASPIIKSGEELLKKIIEDKTSLTRFGDGEFEMMRMNSRPWFQVPDLSLSKRLKEIVKSNSKKINVAIAQNFKNLDLLKDDCADTCREYMASGTAESILEMIDINKTYYDAYVTRPYIIYKERKNADIIFSLFKKIWANRNLIIVEGELSRFAVGNDLLDNANSIKRIICPVKNAWSKYEEIKNAVLKLVKNSDLVLITLGPTATVLAYDLAMEDIQAIDIGQLDNEYEWYVKGAQTRTPITGKLVAEVLDNNGNMVIDGKELVNDRYQSEIHAKVL